LSILIDVADITVSDRISTILREKNLTQKEFADSIFVSGSYISRLLKKELGIAKTTAMLIEHIHGYSMEWILRGTGMKLVPGAPKALSPIQRKLIDEIAGMTDDELFFISVYIEAVKKKKLP
jgi:transcriptional regulator with XRE-family HTH domain